MIVDTFVSLVRSSPRLRKFLWKNLYQLIAGLYPHPEWTFMNYGFVPLSSAEPVPSLSAADEPNRSFIQLYHHTLGADAVKGKDVLEVGCGRGGGSSFISRCMGPRSVCGVDISPQAVRFCRRMHPHAKLSFRVGDSENLPFADGSFDAVVNVESSHCYPSMDRFLAEVKRVLRPGGKFFLADLRDDDQLDSFHESLASSGMMIESLKDISPNVIEAMRVDSGRRVAFFTRTLPRPLVRYFREFAGDGDSEIFHKFHGQRIFYFSCRLRKPEADLAI